ncbi:hypothetical protein DLJ54_01395 [Corynebacterium heidelbergense]|uniref:Uncharacterized protein n=1 Tax=Corynebacterium heidelbergense TaxID=2055947 RepID=A0A364V8H7_9CORY|nr:hypothetical protein DLJ54_01395 [Corynebacterium heidelbergense]
MENVVDTQDTGIFVMCTILWDSVETLGRSAHWALIHSSFVAAPAIYPHTTMRADPAPMPMTDNTLTNRNR